MTDLPTFRPEWKALIVRGRSPSDWERHQYGDNPFSSDDPIGTGPYCLYLRYYGGIYCGTFTRIPKRSAVKYGGRGSR
jgi:hypothetical protein